MRTALLLLTVLVLNGCSGLNFVYMRADGQDMTADPALYSQFEADRVACQSETIGDRLAPAGMGGTGSPVKAGAAQDCMEKRGYIVLSADAAAAKQKELDAAAAEKARLAAEAAAPPPLPPSKRVAAKRKLKPKPPVAQASAPQAVPQWPPPPPPQAAPYWPPPQEAPQWPPPTSAQAPQSSASQ